MSISESSSDPCEEFRERIRLRHEQLYYVLDDCTLHLEGRTLAIRLPAGDHLMERRLSEPQFKKILMEAGRPLVDTIVIMREPGVEEPRVKEVMEMFGPGLTVVESERPGEAMASLTPEPCHGPNGGRPLTESNSNIIRIFKEEFDGETIPACDARELHEFLEVKTAFAQWIVRRIEDAQLVENVDFTKIEKLEFNTKDYVLSLDAGKHVAMLERTEKGRQIRDHFIQYEKRHRAEIANLTPTELLLRQVQRQVEIEKRQKTIESRQAKTDEKIHAIESRQEAIEKGLRYFTVLGFAVMKKFKTPMTLRIAQKAGHKCADICKSLGFEVVKIRDPRFGLVNGYPEQVLEEVFQEMKFK